MTRVGEWLRRLEVALFCHVSRAGERCIGVTDALACVTRQGRLLLAWEPVHDYITQSMDVLTWLNWEKAPFSNVDSIGHFPKLYPQFCPLLSQASRCTYASQFRKYPALTKREFWRHVGRRVSGRLGLFSNLPIKCISVMTNPVDRITSPINKESLARSASLTCWW